MKQTETQMTLPPDHDPISQELNLLHRISMALGYDLSLGDVLQLVVNMTADLMDSKICSILLFDDTHGELSIAATQSLSDAYRHKPNLKLDASISGKAVQTRQRVDQSANLLLQHRQGQQ